MGKRWLGGVVLGMSLVLLLAAGCAHPDCIPCYPGTVRVLAARPEVPDMYMVNLSAELTDGQEYCAILSQNGKQLGRECNVPGARLANASFFVTCEEPTFFLFTDIPGVGPFDGQVENPFGKWQLGAGVVEEANSEDLPDWVKWVVEWLVADVCEPEFVPEPGTLALLGSGLAGLAGYAALRWRARS